MTVNYRPYPGMPFVTGAAGYGNPSFDRTRARGFFGNSPVGVALEGNIAIEGALGETIRSVATGSRFPNTNLLAMQLGQPYAIGLPNFPPQVPPPGGNYRFRTWI